MFSASLSFSSLDSGTNASANSCGVAVSRHSLLVVSGVVPLRRPARVPFRGFVASAEIDGRSVVSASLTASLLDSSAFGPGKPGADCALSTTGRFQTVPSWMMPSPSPS